MTETIITAVTAFAGTNIDDIFINTLLFAQADSPSRVRSVVAGKYLGIGALVLLSWLGVRGLQFLPQHHIRWLGIVPIALGIRAWLSARKTGGDAPETASPAGSLALSTMLITMGNGADNIGVYIPLFAKYSATQMAATAAVFVLMTALWCLLGRRLAALPALQNFLLKRKAVIVPVVFIALGLYILL